MTKDDIHEISRMVAGREWALMAWNENPIQGKPFSIVLQLNDPMSIYKFRQLLANAIRDIDASCYSMWYGNSGEQNH